jgi:hypothetical protein
LYYALIGASRQDVIMPDTSEIRQRVLAVLTAAYSDIQARDHTTGLLRTLLDGSGDNRGMFEVMPFSLTRAMPATERELQAIVSEAVQIASSQLGEQFVAATTFAIGMFCQLAAKVAAECPTVDILGLLQDAGAELAVEDDDPGGASQR